MDLLSLALAKKSSGGGGNAVQSGDVTTYLIEATVDNLTGDIELSRTPSEISEAVSADKLVLLKMNGALGLLISWDGDNSNATFYIQGNVIQFDINQDKSATIDSQSESMLLSAFVPEFDGHAVSAGDFVLVGNDVYECVTDHSAGAWNASNFVKRDTAVVINQIAARIRNIEQSIADSREMKTMTITCTANDSATVTGTVVIKETTQNVVWRTLPYSGQPLTLNVPVGLTYEIYMSSVMNDYFCTDTVRGVVSNTAVSVALSVISEASVVKAINITCTAANATVDGAVIRIVNTATNTVYQDITYHGQPVTVSVPNNFAYKVYVHQSINGYYCGTVVTGVATADVNISFTFVVLSAIATIPDLKAAMQDGQGKYIPIGTEVTMPHSVYGNMVFRVVDYEDEGDTITLEAKNAYIGEMAFDSPEALMAAPNGLAAGNYRFKNGNNYYYFTLTKAIPAGGQLRAITTAFDTYADPTDSTPLELGEVSTTALSEYTDLGTCGSGNLQVMDRVINGSSNYAESNLRQWLNSSALANAWYTPLTPVDRPPAYTGIDGFLAGIDQSILDCIDTAATRFHTTTNASPGSSYAANAAYTISEKFFMPSRVELYGGSNSANDVQFDLYVGSGNNDKKKNIGTSTTVATYWTREAYSNYQTYAVSISGYSINNVCRNAYSVAPACKISKSI